MPTLVGAVIDSMLVALDAPGVDAVVLEHEGRARPLPDRPASRPGARRRGRASWPMASGDCARSPRHSTTTVIPEATWRALDPYAHDGPRHRHARRPGLTRTHEDLRPEETEVSGVLEGGLREEGQPP